MVLPQQPAVFTAFLVADFFVTSLNFLPFVERVLNVSGDDEVIPMLIQTASHRGINIGFALNDSAQLPLTLAMIERDLEFSEPCLTQRRSSFQCRFAKHFGKSHHIRTCVPQTVLDEQTYPSL
jgi:hypothetical protein